MFEKCKSEFRQKTVLSENLSMAIHIQNIFISAVFKKDCVCRLTTIYNQYMAHSLYKRKHVVELQNISFFTKNETDDVP